MSHGLTGVPEVSGLGHSYLGERVEVHAALPDECPECGGYGVQDTAGASWGRRCGTCRGSGVVGAPSRHSDPARDPFAEKPAPFQVMVGW